MDREVPLEGDSGEIETLEHRSISIPVFEEQLVIEKCLVVCERVIVRKQTIIQQQHVHADLRREHLDVAADDEVADRSLASCSTATAMSIATVTGRTPRRAHQGLTASPGSEGNGSKSRRPTIAVGAERLPFTSETSAASPVPRRPTMASTRCRARYQPCCAANRPNIHRWSPARRYRRRSGGTTAPPIPLPL